jgi:hypothetical protein
MHCSFRFAAGAAAIAWNPRALMRLSTRILGFRRSSERMIRGVIFVARAETAQNSRSRVLAE